MKLIIRQSFGSTYSIDLPRHDQARNFVASDYQQLLDVDARTASDLISALGDLQAAELALENAWLAAAAQQEARQERDNTDPSRFAENMAQPVDAS